MPHVELTGDTYDATVGSLVDYERIAGQLIEVLRLRAGRHLFLDLACGTGRLLACLSSRIPDLRSCGFDSSLAQLKQARTNGYRGALTCADVFRLPLTVGERGAVAPETVAYVGHSFMNGFSPNARRTLLSRLRATTIDEVAFEIQDAAVSSRMPRGRWLRRRTVRGGEVASRSSPLNSISYLLELRYDGRPRIGTSQILFPWRTEKCIEECSAAGWNATASKSERSDACDRPSHLLIHCRRIGGAA